VDFFSKEKKMLRGRFLIGLIVGLALIFLASMMENPHTGSYSPAQIPIVLIGLGILAFVAFVYGLCKLLKIF